MSQHKIEYIIDADTLGDDNKPQFNQRYCDAIEKELIAQFPDADITIGISDRTTSPYFLSNIPNVDRYYIEIVALIAWSTL